MFRFSVPQRMAFGLAVIVVCLLLVFVPGSPLPANQRSFVGGMAAGMGAALLALGALWLYPPYRRWMQDKLSDPVLRARQRRYSRDMMPPMIAYVVVMLAWHSLLAHIDALWLRIAIALLPTVLWALVIRAMVRYIRDADELQRRMELEAIAISAALTGMLYMALGFLQSANLVAIPADVAMLWVYPSLCLGYGLAKLLLARRYS